MATPTALHQTKWFTPSPSEEGDANLSLAPVLAQASNPPSASNSSFVFSDEKPSCLFLPPLPDAVVYVPPQVDASAEGDRRMMSGRNSPRSVTAAFPSTANARRSRDIPVPKTRLAVRISSSTTTRKTSSSTGHQQDQQVPVPPLPSVISAPPLPCLGDCLGVTFRDTCSTGNFQLQPRPNRSLSMSLVVTRLSPQRRPLRLRSAAPQEGFVTPLPTSQRRVRPRTAQAITTGSDRHENFAQLPLLTTATPKKSII